MKPHNEDVLVACCHNGDTTPGYKFLLAAVLLAAASGAAAAP